MPPKTKTKPLGRVIINSTEITNASAIEITPAGNGKYAITVRQSLSPDDAGTDFKETFKGKSTILYRNSPMQDMRFTGNFLDFGIQDENGECILSFFFSMEKEKPVVDLT